jgi:hypothetical protein
MTEKILKGLLIVGLMVALSLLLVACQQPTETPTQEVFPPLPTPVPCPECPADISGDVPFYTAWLDSGHADAEAEAFVHWNEEDPAVIPPACANCHSDAGYQDFLGADGSAVGAVDAEIKAPAGALTCKTCHNDTAVELSSVTFPSGVTVEGLGGEARCMVCHQGREAKTTVDAAIEKAALADEDTVAAPDALGFRNIHYFAAAATLYGSQVKGGYEYEGKAYDWKNDHVEGFDTCIGCHNPHTLEVKVENCTMCHTDVAAVEDLKNVREPSSIMDYDGDGDVSEGMFYEIEGLQAMLMSAMQAYSKEVAGAMIAYSPAAYPYFFNDKNEDGTLGDDEAVMDNRYATWTPRLLKAAYNYQVSVKDPGAFAHGNKYIVQLLYDSIEDLNTKISAPVDLSKAHRQDAGHFDGSSMAFRDWDAEGEVPFGCAKCHSATGLPEFLANAGTVTVDARGTTRTAGIGAMPVSNGFACTTCHDETNWPALYAVTSVPFPSGASVTFSKKDADGKLTPDNANLCLECHQGRESTASVNAYLRGKELDVVADTISFKNVHYFGAGATLFGDVAKGAYQYDGKTYVGQHPHVDNGFTCSTCHDVHALEVKTESCVGCHPAAKDGLEMIRMGTVDYDGDGDVTEGVAGEIETLAEALYAEIQKYATETSKLGIVYNAQAYPYYFADADGDGAADKDDKGASIRYNAWTPRLMKAAYNYQYVQKDPGVYAHNPKYVIQFLIDSIQDLGGNVSGYTRP